MRRVILAFAVCLAGAGCTQDPSISEVKPSSLDSCDTIQIKGVYADIQQVAVVDNANAQTPIVPGSLKRTDQTFGISGTVPPVNPGTYRIFIDQKGGFGGYFTINPGNVTSAQTFQVVNTLTAPSVTLTATDAPAPGSPATLTPTIMGTATAKSIDPGNLSASGPQTVFACKTTTYTLTAANRCAKAASAFAVVHVPAPSVRSVSPASVPAGGSVTVTGSAFAHNTCGGTTASLAAYALGQVATSSMTSLAAVVAVCTPPGTYTVTVNTSAGTSTSTSPVRLQVTAPLSPPCPDDGNVCTKEACSGGGCKSTNVANGTACGTNGQCHSGTCVIQTPPPPTCVAQLGTCAKSSDCCQPAVCNYELCRRCVPHGEKCPINGTGGSRICCDQANGDACVGHPVTGEETCDIPG